MVRTTIGLSDRFQLPAFVVRQLGKERVGMQLCLDCVELSALSEAAGHSFVTLW